MQATMERERQRLSRLTPAAPVHTQVENWLFVCDRCGQPITYDEPLQANCTDGKLEVAHLKCLR